MAPVPPIFFFIQEPGGYDESDSKYENKFLKKRVHFNDQMDCSLSNQSFVYRLLKTNKS